MFYKGFIMNQPICEMNLICYFTGLGPTPMVGPNPDVKKEVKLYENGNF